MEAAEDALSNLLLGKGSLGRLARSRGFDKRIHIAL